MRRILLLLSVAALMMVMVALTVGPASATTFSNTDGITINDSGEFCGNGSVSTRPAKASPYPSEIPVSGLGSSVTDVNVTVSGLSHGFPDDIGLLIVSPAGQGAILMTDSGGGFGVSGINLTFDDAALGPLPDGSQLSGGTYLPSRGTSVPIGGSSFGCAAPASFPEPAPASSYGTTLSVFNGTDPNGTWRLYVVDDTFVDAGQIANGWSLEITAADPPPNQEPTAAEDNYTTNEDTTLTEPAPGVLTNYEDADGDPLTAELVEDVANGTLTLNSDGSFTYTPNADFSGSDSFTYKANDGTADSGVATVSISVTAANDAPSVSVAQGGSCGSASDMRGTINLALSDPDDPPESLTLRATSSNRSVLPNGNISFGGGTDASRTMTVSSLTGSGTSNVTIMVSDEGDLNGTVLVRVISGSASNNTLTGSANAEMIFARKGSDTLSARGANDLMCGGNGNDKLTGGPGADRFGGGSGTDTATDFNASQEDTEAGIP